MSNRVSQDQIDVLLDYLIGHSNLAKGVGLGARSKETLERQWEGLASTLNALGTGSSKTGDRWKKYWNDLKHKAKTRAALRRRDQNATGGGPPNPMGDLSETDQKVLAIIGFQAVVGDEQHRVPLFKPQTNAVNQIESQDAQFAIGVEDYQFPIYSSQTETLETEALETEIMETEIYVEEESPATAADNLRLLTSSSQTTRAETAVANPFSPSTSGQTITRAGTSVVNRFSPSTSGQTVTRAGDAENRGRHDNPGPRRLFPPVQRNSPVSHSRRGRTRCVNKSGNAARADSAWVIELERKRVEAEEKLANATLIMAEAARVQAEAERSQVEVVRMLADSVATLVKFIENKK